MWQWHPQRPVIASTDSYGRIVIWAIGYQEKWSAYAPDFKELEENVEYEEREDEFDLVRRKPSARVVGSTTRAEPHPRDACA